MLVEVIASQSQNIPWQISLDSVSMCSERIRRVSIDKFYELVTGNPISFKQLCEKLPLVIEDVVNGNSFEVESNSVMNELLQIDPNLLKSLYLLSFKKYEGFENFNV